jgi:hypothetical protein
VDARSNSTEIERAQESCQSDQGVRECRGVFRALRRIDGAV